MNVRPSSRFAASAAASRAALLSIVIPWLVPFVVGAASASSAGAQSLKKPAADSLGVGVAIDFTESLDHRPRATEQRSNWHMQATFIIQGDPGFRAKYSGVNSLNSQGEVQHTLTLNLSAGTRLWRGAEAHADVLVWQGFGLSQTLGVEAFPNGDAYKVGTRTADLMFARIFVRQTIGLGGAQEDAPDDPLTLAGTHDPSRLTFTLGRFSPLDIGDKNRYADDPHSQFMNWAMMGNLTWDYGQDIVGYATGVAVELQQPRWVLRYTLFQMPRDKNGFAGEDQYLAWPHHGAYGPLLRSWAMMTELERRYEVNLHPGAIRFLTWLNEADMASYKAATAILKANGVGANISAARAYRYKYGVGLNWEQEITKRAGLFSRLGWTDGHNETWTFTDADWSASLGVSVNGDGWRRPGDALGVAAIGSGASRDNQRFLEAGGVDILDGDGALRYGAEGVLESYYDAQLWRRFHLALDYQFVTNPAFNRDRGPVSILGARLHWEF